MKQKTQPSDPPAGPFDPDNLLCGVCGQHDATHAVRIDVQRGLDYDNRKRLYSVDYAVCGICAREIVEVKLAVTLHAATKHVVR